MSRFTEERKEEFKRLIGIMSYYNAAESPQWGNESSARGESSGNMQDTIYSWFLDGVTIEELEEFHKKNRGLTSFYELFPYKRARNEGKL